METFYLVSAVAGGTILLCQFVFSLFGGGDHDIDGSDFSDGHSDIGHVDDFDHHGNSLLVGILTFRTLVAGMTIFGLSGMAALSSGRIAPGIAFVIALTSAAGTVVVLAWVMNALHSLKAEGTARIERAIGKTGTVYLQIPGQKAGLGKVALNLQNRTVIYQAMTAHDTINTGSKIVVVNILGSDTVEVEPAVETERVA
ncbi:MAG: hypothetical protein KatS3mg105_1516 [Gemmatales bacterium]|nr:MAG: hypothetical protein KatS3mg105_1516 [Gemmatales bacterium]